MWISAAHIWFSMNFNSSRQIWKPIQIIELQVWLCARLEFFVRSDLYLSFFLWLLMGRLKRNWNWWPVLTFSTGLKFQLAAMATGPWKLDPDRSREKLKTATAALNWRKVAYKCQWQALNWNNLPLPVPKKKNKKERNERQKTNKQAKPKKLWLDFFLGKNLLQFRAHVAESSRLWHLRWQQESLRGEKGARHALAKVWTPQTRLAAGARQWPVLKHRLTFCFLLL